MLINEEEYQILMKVEDITHTNYNVLKLRDNPKEYLIYRESMISLLQDLTYHVEEMEEEKNQCES